MAVYRFTSHVEAPPERVFAQYTDFEHAAENISAIRDLTVLTDGPIGKGTRFRETRFVMKREATEEMEITAFDPNRGYSVGCDSCGCRWGSDFTFTPENGGTRVDLVMHSKALTLGAKLMSPMGVLFAGMIKKCVQQDLDELKAHCEGAAPTEAQPA